MLKIDNIEFKSNSKTQVYFHPYGMPIDLPVTVICGKNPGMTMMVSAQTHSGEYNGSGALMRLAKEIEPEKLTGNLIFFHCVNVTGFWQRKRRFIPEDMSNLNNNFPGNKNGTVGNRLRH